MFDGARWGDDPRDRGDSDRGLGRGACDSRNRDRGPSDPRDVFTKDLDLPRGRERRPVRERNRVYEINGEESRVLATVGAFRVVAESDLHDVRDDTQRLCTASGWTTRRAPSGWPAHPSSPTPSTAATAKSSASSCHASTCISLPWLTSPDTNSRGRPGGRPREMRLSPSVAPATLALRSAVLSGNSRGGWPQLISHAQFAGRAGRRLSVWAAPFAAHWKARMSQSGC